MRNPLLDDPQVVAALRQIVLEMRPLDDDEKVLILAVLLHRSIVGALREYGIEVELESGPETVAA